MKTSVRQLILVSLLTFALDQTSKYWLLSVVTRGTVILNKYMSLVMVWNRGVSFGMLSRTGSDATAYLLVVMALLVSGVIARAALQSPSFWERACYGMIIGGALGNAIDRLRFGAVADFFYVHVGALGWPAFNVADSAICIAVSLLLLRLVRDSKVGA